MKKTEKRLENTAIVQLSSSHNGSFIRAWWHLQTERRTKDNSKYFGGQYYFCFIHKWLWVNSRWNESIWKCSLSNATLDNISMASKFQVGQWGMAYRNRSYARLNLNLHKIEDSSWDLIEADMFIMFASTFLPLLNRTISVHLTSLGSICYTETSAFWLR